MENLEGTGTDDVLTGNAGPNVIAGSGGHDQVQGLGGDDLTGERTTGRTAAGQ